MTLKQSSAEVTPYISASQSLPEITPRALILGIFLAVVLAASSTFVGLKIARTIAASIPAALISMLILRRFKNANILENNMVQTIASAGEVVAAGVIYTLPALILIGYWQSFDYLQTTAIAVIGGVLGVLFSVPLRRTLIVKDKLPYPEGVATGEVLRAGEGAHTGSTKVLLRASLFSAGLAFLQSGFKIAGEHLQYWTKAGSTVFGINLAMSPVLMAAGYIVGLRGLFAFITGGLLTWGLAIPIFVSVHGLPEAPDLASAMAMIQKAHFRYVAVGVLAVGGLWSVISLMKSVIEAFKASIQAMKNHKSEFAKMLRTDRDMPFSYVIFGTVGLAIPIFILFCSVIENAHFGVHSSVFWLITFFATIFSLVVAFIAAAIAAYITGIVGTTSLPISGITIFAIIVFSSILLLTLRPYIDFHVNTDLALKAAGVVIVFAAIICVAAAVSGDNMQDLKAGQLVGATPWKQQLMLVIGAVAAALVIPFILQTTFEAYGIGDILPRSGMNPEHALPAPQATLMATIAKGFFVGQLPWNMILAGAALAVVAIIFDTYLKKTKSGYRFSPLIFALGIYFPFGYVTAFFVGGLINALANWGKASKADASETNHGVLCASGIIAGEAILGALLTIPFAYYQSTDIFALKAEWLTRHETLIGVLFYLGLCAYLYKRARKA